MTPHRQFLMAAVGVTVLLGCARGEAAGEKPMQFQRLALYDVQGLWGGRNVYVDRSGVLWIQIVKSPKPGESGLQEKRYKLALKPARIAELEALLGERRFKEIDIKDRPGVPDEARPTIELTEVNGNVVAKRKWSNDKHPDFDAIYERLAGLETLANEKSLVYSGKVDFAWRPDGFMRR